MKHTFFITAFLMAICVTELQAQTRFDGILGTDSVFTYSVNDLLVYPNPVISTTRIVLPVPSIDMVNVDIIDLNGNIVRSEQYPAGSYNLDVDMSRLPASIYSVRISGKGDGFHNLKVVKN